MRIGCLARTIEMAVAELCYCYKNKGVADERVRENVDRVVVAH